MDMSPVIGRGGPSEPSDPRKNLGNNDLGTMTSATWNITDRPKRAMLAPNPIGQCPRLVLLYNSCSCTAARHWECPLQRSGDCRAGVRLGRKAAVNDVGPL